MTKTCSLQSSGTYGICKKQRYFLRKIQNLNRYRVALFPKIRSATVTVYRKFQKFVPYRQDPHYRYRKSGIRYYRTFADP